MTMEPIIWNEVADICQNFMLKEFWDNKLDVFFVSLPPPTDLKDFHYWWQAHALDSLVDAFNRTGDEDYKAHVDRLVKGLITLNGGTIYNNYYDDMEWFALALLRAYKALEDAYYLNLALLLWEDIKGGWNDHCGGGIAWRKTQLDYKNTPANAPAAILAARLYMVTKEDDHLDWAKQIFTWQKENLVNPKTGFVWDGMNRMGDGSYDYDWKFTYCQGVYLGAALELYRITKEQHFLDEALRTAHYSSVELSTAEGILPNEGAGYGDEGLFKGIFVRYLTDLALETDDLGIAHFLLENGFSLWQFGRNKPCLFSDHWGRIPDEVPVSLSVQLSGVMLMESLALLQRRGLIK